MRGSDIMKFLRMRSRYLLLQRDSIIGVSYEPPIRHAMSHSVYLHLITGERLSLTSGIMPDEEVTAYYNALLEFLTEDNFEGIVDLEDLVEQHYGRSIDVSQGHLFPGSYAVCKGEKNKND